MQIGTETLKISLDFLVRFAFWYVSITFIFYITAEIGTGVCRWDEEM